MESIPKQNIDRLHDIAAEAAEPLGLLILRMTARGTPSRAILEVILDGPRQVSIDDCQTVSKKINDAIEADESLLKGNYRLDVLSPGLDEPIVHDYQFQRTIGHLVEINSGTQQVSGILKSFTADEVVVVKRKTKKQTEPVEISILRAEISSVYARPDFG
jgi:ribosome maturation factor RimP